MGTMAVFFTPAIISGTAKMKFSQFALWNFFASILFTLSVTATAYGFGPGNDRPPFQDRHPYIGVRSGAQHLAHCSRCSAAPQTPDTAGAQRLGLSCDIHSYSPA